MSSYEILLTKVKLPAVRSLLEVAHASEHPHGVIVDHSGVMVLGRDLTRPLARPLTLGHQVPGLGGKVERPQLGGGASQILDNGPINTLLLVCVLHTWCPP